MTSLASRLKMIEKFSIDNSPVILTAIGVAGVITTAILTHRAAWDSSEKLRYEDAKKVAADPKAPPLTGRETFEHTWKYYIPPVLSGTATIGCIVMSNRIGTKRAAALAAAYTISEKAFTEYKEKVVEIVGENQERKVRDGLAQDRVERNPVDGSKVVVAGSGDVLCYDSFSGRYFMSSMESLRKAENDINYKILHEEYASLTDFYNSIGIEKTSISEEVGWNTTKMLELHFSTTMSADNRPCISIDFNVLPVRDYWRNG